MTTGWRITIILLTIAVGYGIMYVVMINGWGVVPKSHGWIFLCYVCTSAVSVVQGLIARDE